MQVDILTSFCKINWFLNRTENGLIHPPPHTPPPSLPVFGSPAFSFPVSKSPRFLFPLPIHIIFRATHFSTHSQYCHQLVYFVDCKCNHHCQPFPFPFTNKRTHTHTCTHKEGSNRRSALPPFTDRLHEHIVEYIWFDCVNARACECVRLCVI